MNTEILLQENAGVPLATPAIPYIEVGFVAAGPTLTTTNITSATTGAINLRNLWEQGSEKKLWPINVAMLRFAHADATANDDAGDIAIYAGHDDGSDFKLVCKATLTTGTRFKAAVTGDDDTLYVDTITLDGNNDWGADGVQVLGNANNDIAELGFDLRGCTHLLIVCDEAETEVYLTGF